MSNDSVELSNDINVITAEINAYQQVAGEAIFEIGRRLKYVKETDLVHGAWSKWCESEIGMTRQHAHRFIKVFEELGTTDVTSGLHIGVKALYEIATMPEEQRDKSHTIPSTGETKTVDEMTVRELREVKKALKQANEDKQILGQLLMEERNKPSEVEYVKDTESEERLRLYRERYEDISENVYRITNETEISGMVMEFSECTRDFIKQYAFLKHYEGEFHALNKRSKAEYESKLNALRDFLNDVQRVVEYSKTSTFQSCI
ncbi:DUF3102 domain-containing protein [Bacillus thuringiensis]|uniref:DUF3102 domain-containing protein n=1 Tax=Bacillus thuringiensis TaxID=1428 RepID=UPI001F0B3D84|nr:DUF3102 domain-containing protein [Bacillus thuringiensis]